MLIVGWVIWSLAGAWTLFGLFGAVVDFASSGPAMTGDGIELPPRVKRTIRVVYVLGFVIALALTFSLVPKMHLLWFAPVFHLFGTQWIASLSPDVRLQRTMRRLQKDLREFAVKQGKATRAEGGAAGQLAPTVAPTRFTPKLYQTSGSALERFPLLHLYFDSPSELVAAYNSGKVQLAVHEQVLRELALTPVEVADNEKLLLDLYGRNVARFRLLDGFYLNREVEESYWDYLTGKEPLPDPATVRDPELSKMMESTVREIRATLAALRVRYGLDRPEGESTQPRAS